MSAHVLVLELDDRDALRREYETRWIFGGAFVPSEAELAEGDACQLLVVRPGDGAPLPLEARAVWVVRDEGCRGVGVAFTGFDEDAARRLAAFVEEAPAGKRGQDRDQDRDRRSDHLRSGRVARRHVHERLRNLTPSEVRKVALKGETHERIVLERLYGKASWKHLLENPHLSVPEVARMARKGSMPRPFLELIVANAAWLRAPQVRRALLANPRLGKDHVLKVLRLTPKHELKLVPHQTAYPVAVREAARKMLK